MDTTQKLDLDIKREKFINALQYTQDMSASFFEYSKISNISQMLDFCNVLEECLNEAEYLGLGQRTALIAPLVGMPLSMVDISRLGSNQLLIPFSYIVGMPGDVQQQAHMSIGGHIYNLNWCDLGNHELEYVRQMEIHASSNKVIAPILYQFDDQGVIDLDNLKVTNPLSYYPMSRTNASIDIGEFIQDYLNRWLTSTMSYNDRESIAYRDAFVANVIADNFSSIEIPASMMVDAFKLLSLTGDDIRHSRNYRIANFVDKLTTTVARQLKTTIILK